MAAATAQTQKHSIRQPLGRPRWSRRRWPASAVVAAALFALAGCADDPQKPVDPCTEQPCGVDAVVAHLRDAYARRDYTRFDRLLHEDFRFVYPNPQAPTQRVEWGRLEERRIHLRMFRPQSIPTGDEPVHPDLWLASVSIAVTKAQPLAEMPEFYRSAANPTGLDPARWKAWGADYDTQVLFDTQGRIDYQVLGRAQFVVAEDLSKAAGAPGAYSLYRWQELGGRDPRAAGVDPRAWWAVKQLYRPRNCGEPCTPEGAIDRLSDAYRRRDYTSYSKLFHEAFLFILPSADPPLPEYWDTQEELRIHRRMFDSQHLSPGELPVDPQLWLASVTIALTAAQPFRERPEFYRSASNPNGLDSTRWKAWATDYDTSVLWDMRGEIDYQVNARAYFVVAQDLEKPFGEPGRFTLYRWQDLGGRPTGTIATSERSWSRVKLLYR